MLLAMSLTEFWQRLREGSVMMSGIVYFKMNSSLAKSNNLDGMRFSAVHSAGLSGTYFRKAFSSFLSALHVALDITDSTEMGLVLLAFKS